jgi:YfiH family protein
MAQRSSFEIGKTLIQARAWRQLPGVLHGFTTRHSSDRELPRWCLAGRAVAGQTPALQGGPVLLKQIHSDIVRPVGSPPAAPPRGDALITATPRLALAVRTADCLPVLLFDPGVPAAGVVHAGWRGTVRRIAEKTVAALRASYGADPARMHAVIGPGIHSCCYEVGEDVIEAFHSQFAYADALFRNVQPENPADILMPRQVLTAGPSPLRAHLDLEEANRRQLIAAGLKPENIVTGAPCTACRNDLLYSYRREGAAAGRLHAFIALR